MTKVNKESIVKMVRQSHKSLFVKLHDYPNISIGNVIEVSITKQNKIITFIGMVKEYHKSYGINIPQFLVEKFNLQRGNIIKITNVRKIDLIKRPSELFMSNKIDLLSLIPLTTRKDKQIYVNIFERNKEEWLRVWALGVKIQLELKRYISIKTFGNLLGQIQAEGPKFQNNRTPHVSFSNILIKEHEDFINALRHIGISDDLFYVQCRYDHVRKKEVELAVQKFIEITGININGYLTKRKKGIEFDTYVLSSLLAEILLNSMNRIRKMLCIAGFNENLKLLAENFLVKLLNGDGNLSIFKVKREGGSNLKEGYILRGKISDKCNEYREDYLQILKRLGFNARDDKNNNVYFSCKLQDLLYLFQIGAFKGTHSWTKLLYAIKLRTNGKKHLIMKSST